MSDKKKKTKRAPVTGFDGIGGPLTEKRLVSLRKNKVEGDWRREKQLKVKYTIISRLWQYEDHQFTQRYFAPLGMVKHMEDLITNEQCSNFRALPTDVKEAMPFITSTSYNSRKMSVKCTNNGDQGYGTFYWLYCTYCIRHFLPIVLERYKEHLPELAKFEDLVENWDKIEAVDKKVVEFKEVCGTFLPNDIDIIAGPNNRKFILRPEEHSKKHFDSSTTQSSTSSCTTSSSSSSSLSSNISRKRPAGEPLQSYFSKTAGNTLVSGSDGKLATSAGTTITGTKNSKKVSISLGKRPPKMMDISKMMDPRISLFDAARDDDEEFAQNHCLELVLSGVNSNISQRTVVSMYQDSANGILKYHNVRLGDIEVNGKKFAPPPKVRLNEHNIANIELGILNGYKEIDSTTLNYSPYSALRGPFSKYYSIFNDGIQKFGMELNGVMVRVLDENFQVTNIPWALTKIPGGSMNSVKLCSQIMSVVSSIQRFGQGSSFQNAPSLFLQEFEAKFPDEIAPSPPSIFKCCTLSSIDFDSKCIQLMFENWPVALVADGCSANKKAGESLVAQYGLLSPTTRCSGHAASGSIKRLASSKTMCVEEVVTFAAGIRPILRHFQLSGKSTSLLNDALSVMEMKQIKVMTWCPTRMSNLLDASARTVHLLFPLCDVLTSCDIKREERAYFMSPICFGILHLMADLQGVMVGDFLRKLDTDDAVIMDVFGESKKFISALDVLKTPLYDQFLDGLKMDTYGNVQYHCKANHVTLQYSSRPSRRDEDKVSIIKNELSDLKQKVITNLQENVTDQSQGDSIVEYASAFDLSYRCEKDVRLKHVKKLHSMYGVEYSHQVENDDDCSNALPGYEIEIKYPAKLKCSEEELLEEYNKIWPVLNKLWLKFKDTKPHKNVSKRFWMKVLEEHSIDFPNIAELILILLAISPGTGPLERSYSKLAKTCYKDRAQISSETLETLYLLCTLQIKNNDDELFSKVRAHLQRK